ncbi:MAG: DUF1501 domain-containing protein [Pirellulales bacterium]|nr:DUF1501 domain-containing protein [Pirellulales bacterium]
MALPASQQPFPASQQFDPQQFHAAQHAPYQNLASDWNRRQFLRVAGIGAGGWLTMLAHQLARADEAQKVSRHQPATAIILLWMQGGPSQLETFDPHPGTEIGGPTKSIPTATKGVKIAQGLEQTAEILDRMSLIRTVTSKEGDHERGTYTVKTGYRPLPAVVHPSLGAIVCHELPAPQTEIPRHISILPGQWPGRGGFLGDEYDAFKTFDPINPVPDVQSAVDENRQKQRLSDLEMLEKSFARGRERQAAETRNRDTMLAAKKMMGSKQLAAFDISKEPRELLAAYGNTEFGRSCLVARKLVQTGVRAVEVTLDGWDTHANNFEGVSNQLKILDPALATLIRDLEQHNLLDTTLVVWAGEFGRTPNINPFKGRDHWPHAFTVVTAGGGLKRGLVLGETDPGGGRKVPKSYSIADLHATFLSTLGINPKKELYSPFGQPVKLAEGTPLPELL